MTRKEQQQKAIKIITALIENQIDFNVDKFEYTHTNANYFRIESKSNDEKGINFFKNNLQSTTKEFIAKSNNQKMKYEYVDLSADF